MKHQLMRVFGKDQYLIGSFNSQEEAAEYATRYIAQTGNLWKNGTQFIVRTVYSLGMLVDGELVPLSKMGFVNYEWT